MKDTQTLMHKDKKVAECRFDSRGYLKKIGKVFDAKHLPVCVDPEKETFMLDMQRWVLSRNLAASRRDIAPLREFYGTEAFQTKLGLSLFDGYWFATKEANDWDACNAYDNWDCKKDSVFLMFAYPEELRIISTDSPNLTIPGRAHKLWYKEEDGFYLLHGDAQKEMARFKLAEGCPYVARRSYQVVAGQIYAAMKSETGKNVERIPLEDYYNACHDPSKTKFKNLETCCETFGLKGWRDFITQMSAFDDKISNTTRELCDVGVLRDPDSLEFIGFAKL